MAEFDASSSLASATGYAPERVCRPKGKRLKVCGRKPIVKHAALASARALVALVLMTCAPPVAARSQFHPDLVDAESELDTAKGPEVYAALRRLWATANRADPDQVAEMRGWAAT